MAVDGGKVLGSAGAGAAAGSAFGPWGTLIGGAGGALVGLLSGGGDNEAPQAPPSQFAGSNGAELTNQLAALQYSQGLQQQQAQNAREAAFYNQGNGNFDIGNAAQLRGGPQIESNAADQQRQLAALGATNAGIGRMNSTGDLLTDMGTRAMGPSVAEAQLRLGQSDAMNQQLAMARSGRTLGSGQAAMNQAAFNNAQINQSTNQQAAAARLQEQQNYQNMQLSALQGAGNSYNAGGALAGQAGNQATGIRQGNEGLQAQNAALGQSQQQINNQTTGMYNQLGAQQQQLGMQANQQGQNAFQFGQQQGQNMQQSQLNANVGQTSSIVATNLANQQNANAHDAANMNMAAAGLGAVGSALGSASEQPAAPVNQNNPSGSTSPYSNITTASNTAGKNNLTNDRSSDERQKTNIKALEGSSEPVTGSTITGSKTPVDKYAGFSPAAAAAYRAADEAAAAGGDTYTANDKTELLRPHGDAPMDDESAGRKAVYGELSGHEPQPPTYAQTIAALNNAYRPSQFAPVDVLNHVPGAGAGHSASQDAVIAALSGRPQAVPGAPLRNAQLPTSFDSVPAADPSLIGDITGVRQGVNQVPRPAAAPPPAPPSAAWGDVFNAPALDPRVQAYLNGGSPYQVAPPSAPRAQAAPVILDSNSTTSAYMSGNAAPSSAIMQRLPGDRSSDVHSKTKIRQLETQLAALSADAPPTASFAPQQPDTGALDEAYRRQGGEPMGWRPRQPDFGSLDEAYARDQNAPAVDLRPAQGYEYQYKDPDAPGAAPGRHVGPMAQDLEHTAAAGTVRDTPHGKVVDTEGLTMVNTAALSEQQRKTAELERQIAALSGSGLGPMPAHNQALYARPGAF